MKQTLPPCRRGVVLAGLLAIIAAGCGGLPAVPDEQTLNTSGFAEELAAARGLMTQSRLKEAVAGFRELAQDYPGRPEPAYLIGECLYRMRDFAGAEAQFEAVRAAHPNFDPAIHRLWLVRLTRSSGARALIQREIADRLAAAPAKPEGLLTAYRGYQYLRDATKRRATIERLVPMSAGLPERSAIASFLLEEILLAAAPAQRARLAELFIQHFADHRGIRLASRIYVRVQVELDDEKAAALLARYPDNRHMMQAVAERLIETQTSLARAERLLDAHLRHWRQAQLHEARWYANSSVWRTVIRWEAAHTDYLRGLLSMYREERLAAQAWLEQAVVNHPQRWQVYAALYDNAAGDRDSEMLNLALSLAAGNPRPQAAHLLEERFPEWREHTRLPGVTVASARFENVTQAAGLAVYRAQRVAWGDYDNDGFADLLLDGKRLLRNVAGTVFVDTALASQVAIVNRATGGVWGDVDNDGYLDVLITRRGDNRLLKNWHGEGFTDITADAFTDLFLGRTEAAAWGDIDNDGWIDLYTANYEVGGLERGFCRPDQLFQNLGDGRFAEHSQALNVVTDEPHCGRGVTWSDIDRDGYQDILVSNYRLDPNLLWKNQAGKGFIDVAGRWGFRGRNDGGAYGHSIGSVAADIDGDRQVDVYVSNLAHPRYLDVSDTSRLLLQNTAGVFSDRSSRSGIGFDETSADPLFADFDNDGDLDLYVTSIYPARVSHLYQNQGYGRFADITAYSGTQTANAWGAAAADYDHDGYLDLLVASRDGVRLFRNLGGANHWLGVRIRSPVCNHFGIGARITVAYGDRTTEREVTAGRGTGSQDPFTAHFGLGDYDGPVEITIRDLCGQIERRKVAVPDRIIEFR